ncbi:MAG TPA: acyl carrier protein [Streptosporangiaceae bacterium]|nr:acyl carrier protein [Streptosporangiaceae bacterium]
MTRTQARQAIEEVLREIAPDADVDNLPPDANLRDWIELDSLDFLNFVEALGKRSGLRIDEDDYPQLATMASGAEFLAGR